MHGYPVVPFSLNHSACFIGLDLDVADVTGTISGNGFTPHYVHNYNSVLVHPWKCNLDSTSLVFSGRFISNFRTVFFS